MGCEEKIDKLKPSRQFVDNAIGPFFVSPHCDTSHTGSRPPGANIFIFPVS